MKTPILYHTKGCHAFLTDHLYQCYWRLCTKLREIAAHRWAPRGLGPRRPIWQAVDEAGLCSVHHRFSEGSPLLALYQHLTARRGKHRAMTTRHSGLACPADWASRHPSLSLKPFL